MFQFSKVCLYHSYNYVLGKVHFVQSLKRINVYHYVLKLTALLLDINIHISVIHYILWLYYLKEFISIFWMVIR